MRPFEQTNSDSTSRTFSLRKYLGSVRDYDDPGPVGADDAMKRVNTSPHTCHTHLVVSGMTAVQRTKELWETQERRKSPMERLVV